MFTDMLCNFVGEERVTGAKNVCFGSYLHSCYPCSGKYILLPEGGKNPQALAMFPMNLDSQMTSKGIQGCCLSPMVPEKLTWCLLTGTLTFHSVGL